MKGINRDKNQRSKDRLKKCTKNILKRSQNFILFLQYRDLYAISRINSPDVLLFIVRFAKRVGLKGFVTKSCTNIYQNLDQPRNTGNYYKV